MRITFTKMHGAGNDFVMVDDRAGQFPWQRRNWLARMAARRTGIGCEGVVLIQPDADADLRMRFFNPDGSEAEMCGNAARCTARFAFDRGLTSTRMRIATVAGPLSAECLASGRVKVQMTPPTDRRTDLKLTLEDGCELCVHCVNTGVPHAILEVSDLDDVDVKGVGREIRQHPGFAPVGTNVNFVAPLDDGGYCLRTYERGVEDETLACGTGMVAVATMMAELGRCSLPVDIQCASGDRLTINGKMNERGLLESVSQTGPAHYVYEGTLEVDEA